MIVRSKISQPPLSIDFDAKDKNYSLVSFRGVLQVGFVAHHHLGRVILAITVPVAPAILDRRSSLTRCPLCACHVARCQNPTFRVDDLEALVTSFTSRPSDVFICTYPK